MTDVRRINVPKPGGGAREIYIARPGSRLNHLAQKIAHRSAGWKFVRLLSPPDPRFLASPLPASREGDPPVTAAHAAAHHLYQEAVLCVDIADFFGSIRLAHMTHVDEALTAARYAPRLVLFGGRWLSCEAAGRAIQRLAGSPGPTPQGLSSSPVLAMLAGALLDRAIAAAVAHIPVRISRYVDDIAISGSVDAVRAAGRVVAEIAADMGFSLSQRKTRLYTAQGGRAVICGVSVALRGAPMGAPAIMAARAVRRRCRAAQHGAPDAPAAAGLANWCDHLGLSPAAAALLRTRSNALTSAYREAEEWA